MFQHIVVPWLETGCYRHFTFRPSWIPVSPWPVLLQAVFKPEPLVTGSRGADILKLSYLREMILWVEIAMTVYINPSSIELRRLRPLHLNIFGLMKLCARESRRQAPLYEGKGKKNPFILPKSCDEHQNEKPLTFTTPTTIQFSIQIQVLPMKFSSPFVLYN